MPELTTTKENDPAPAADHYRLCAAVEFMGEARDSAATTVQELVRRGDGQVIQVGPTVAAILHLVADGEPTTGLSLVQLAERLPGSEEGVTVDVLDAFLARQLVPMGLVEVVEGASPRAPRPGRAASSASPASSASGTAVPRPLTAAPVLALTLRGTLLPAVLVRRLAALLSPLFAAPLVVAALVALIGADAWLLATADPAAAYARTVLTPLDLLWLYLGYTACAVVHELGHAAACHRSGARPGRVGVGVYLVFLAFFTDVTDSYRADRKGRLRTDLGGLYFNVLTLLGLAAGYVLTESPPVLLLIVLIHLGMAQQLLPVIRVDGYYLVADATGVPDLFRLVGPVLRSLRPGRPTDPVLAALRPGARRVVRVWVLLTVPFLLVSLALLLVNLPFLLVTTWQASLVQLQVLQTAVQLNDPAVAVLAIGNLAALALPLIGAGVIITNVARLPITWLRSVRRARTATTAISAEPRPPSPPSQTQESS